MCVPAKAVANHELGAPHPGGADCVVASGAKLRAMRRSGRISDGYRNRKIYARRGSAAPGGRSVVLQSGKRAGRRRRLAGGGEMWAADQGEGRLRTPRL